MWAMACLQGVPWSFLWEGTFPAGDREGSTEVAGGLPHDSAALPYITIVAPVTTDSKYDFSCQAAGRKQNVIYSQIQPPETHTWLPRVGATETHPPRGRFTGQAEKEHPPSPHPHASSELLRAGSQGRMGVPLYFSHL